MPERALGPSKWKDIVANERKAVLESRLAAPKRKACDVDDDMDVDADLRIINDARVVPGAYLLSDFRVKDADLAGQVKRTLAAATLNEEQERAFRIVANHSVSVTPSPLLIYIAGMGGTGKTRVIDTVRRWFDARSEANRMIVLAPTGAAASVVRGSTYHSYLGVATGDRRNYAQRGGKALEEARLRMRGVDYIFMDEISMVSCQDLYLIDTRLKDITQLDDQPFGGISVIVAGDFAQLPPARGLSLYSGEVSKVQTSRQVTSDQENTLGLLLWNLFVTVVVLRKNMRQTDTSASAEDDLRSCLIRMRYKDCTESDLRFLRSLIPGNNPEINLSDDIWRDVSVITAWNTHKDQINDMNAVRFACENRKPLHMFYSIDKQGRSPTSRSSKKSADASTGPKIRLTDSVREALWRSPPYTSEHVPGCLALCVGMPVMIRNNDATELGITKGQEGRVKGWTSHEIPGYPGRFALDVLFVQLINPKDPIKLPYLEDNVVPLTRMSTSLRAVLPDDSTISIVRQQVPVMLNFAMTDYASQGKTREVNIVDLNRSRNHQAMYTALSRGTSAAATVILRDFKESKLTGGISGYLRQEFRMIDTLDEITTARYTGRLPSGVVQRLRASTVLAYKSWLRSTPTDDIAPCANAVAGADTVSGGTKRKLDGGSIEQEPALKRSRVHETSSSPDTGSRGTKRKLDGGSIEQEPALKRSKVHATSSSPGVALDAPAGRSAPPLAHPDRSFVAGWISSWSWDGADWSCAYDSYLTILRYIWYTRDRGFLDNVAGRSWYYTYLFDRFAAVDRRVTSLAECRDGVRERLWLLDSISFPRGQRGTDLFSLVRVIGGIPLDPMAHVTHRLCLGCHSRTPGSPFEGIGGYTVFSTALNSESRVSTYLQSLEYVAGSCTSCHGDLMIENEYPPLMCVQLPHMSFAAVKQRLVIDTSVILSAHDYRLAGLVYWSGNDYHFASRVIDDNLRVHRYDGMHNNGSLTHEFTLTSAAQRFALSTLDHRVASLAVYVRVDRNLLPRG